MRYRTHILEPRRERELSSFFDHSGVSTLIVNTVFYVTCLRMTESAVSDTERTDPGYAE